MFKNKTLIVSKLIFGIVVVISSIILGFTGTSGTITGWMIGIGAGIIGATIADLYVKNKEDKNPEIKLQNSINHNDERNVYIRTKAKCASGEITKWFFVGLAAWNISIDGALWLSYLFLAMFFAYYVIYFCFLYKYNKED